MTRCHLHKEDKVGIEIDDILTPEERKKMNYLKDEVKKCAICRKEFFADYRSQKTYAYQEKRRKRFYCSWTCFRKGKKR